MAPWETDIELPNINCAKCTLQVIQFMADHVYNQPGGYAYHQCADLEIAADPAKPIDTRWPATNDEQGIEALAARRNRMVRVGPEPLVMPVSAA